MRSRREVSSAERRHGRARSSGVQRSVRNLAPRGVVGARVTAPALTSANAATSADWLMRSSKAMTARSARPRTTPGLAPSSASSARRARSTRASMALDSMDASPYTRALGRRTLAAAHDARRPSGSSTTTPATSIFTAANSTPHLHSAPGLFEHFPLQEDPCADRRLFDGSCDQVEII
jgi:hypothetical protein